MRPTIAEERTHAIAEQLDEWQLAEDERRALEATLATPWKRNGPFVALAFFGLTLFAMSALYTLCKSVGATGFAAAVIDIGLAEFFIRRKRMYGSGLESALWIGGLLAFIFSLPSSGKPEAMLVIAAAFAIAAWRMQNAFFGMIGAVFVCAYCMVRLERSHNYWVVAMVGLVFAVAAIVAKWQEFRRPWIDSFWSQVAIVMPLVAEIGGRLSTLDSKGHLQFALAYAILGGIALAAGLYLREHALLIAAAVSFAITAFEAHDLIDTPLEWKLIAGGAALLAIAAVVARALRGRTHGLVATPARLTRYDEVIKLGGTMLAASGSHEHAASTDPNVSGTSGGAGSFGGAGATGDY